MTATIRQIDGFLALKRIAVVGVSRNPKEISYTLWQELRQRRYDAIAVNPAATEIDGKRAYASVRDIDPPVEGALIMTTAAVAEQVIEDCAAAGIGHVWLYGGLGGGATSPATIAAAERHGIDTIAGHCPYMFLPGTPVFHRMHGVGKKLTGSYPEGGLGDADRRRRVPERHGDDPSPRRGDRCASRVAGHHHHRAVGRRRRPRVAGRRRPRAPRLLDERAVRRRPAPRRAVDGVRARAPGPAARHGSGCSPRTSSRRAPCSRRCGRRSAAGRPGSTSSSSRATGTCPTPADSRSIGSLRRSSHVNDHDPRADARPGSPPQRPTTGPRLPPRPRRMSTGRRSHHGHARRLAADLRGLVRLRRRLRPGEHDARVPEGTEHAPEPARDAPLLRPARRRPLPRGAGHGRGDDRGRGDGPPRRARPRSTPAGRCATSASACRRSWPRPRSRCSAGSGRRTSWRSTCTRCAGDER